MSNLRPLTDEECEALDHAYRKSEVTIKQNIYWLINNKDFCDDCLQETILRAITYIDKFMASDNKAGWLVKASTYATMMFIKKEWKYTHNIVPLDSLLNVIRYSVVAPDPEGRLAIIALIKKRMSKKNGEFFELIMTTNKNNKELAEMLDISEAAIRSKWKRMVDEFRKLPDEIKDKIEFL